MGRGDTLSELALTITRQDLVRYAGAANDYLPQHWDQELMRGQGFPDVVVHGWLGCAHLIRMAAAELTPDRWRLARYAVRYRQPLFPGEVRCGGTVMACDTDGCEIEGWIRDAAGATVTTATMRFERVPEPVISLSAARHQRAAAHR